MIFASSTYEQAFLLLSDQNITWKRDREDALLLALRGGGKGYDPIVYGSDDCIMIEELDDDDSLSLSVRLVKEEEDVTAFITVYFAQKANKRNCFKKF